MTTNNKATIQDVYNIVNRLEDKMDARLISVEKQCDRNTGFINRAIGIGGIIGAVVGGAISIFWNKVNGE